MAPLNLNRENFVARVLPSSRPSPHAQFMALGSIPHVLQIRCLRRGVVGTKMATDLHTPGLKDSVMADNDDFRLEWHDGTVVDHPRQQCGINELGSHRASSPDRDGTSPRSGTSDGGGGPNRSHLLRVRLSGAAVEMPQACEESRWRTGSLRCQLDGFGTSAGHSTRHALGNLRTRGKRLWRPSVVSQAVEKLGKTALTVATLSQLPKLLTSSVFLQYLAPQSSR